MGEWFDDEEFWAIFGDCMFRPDRFEAAAEEVEAILALTGVETRRVLDLGCGPGRHAVPLAERGLAVTAVDLSSQFIDRGRRYAKDREVDVDWRRADMRNVREDDHYDLVLSLWTSFGYFDEPDDDVTVLANAYASLRDGGALLIDIAGKEIICRDIEPVNLTEYDDGDLLIERPTLDEAMTRYHNEWTLVRGDTAHRAHWHHNLYSAQELVDRLGQVGFDDVSVYGGLDGSDYDLAAERLVAVAWK